MDWYITENGVNYLNAKLRIAHPDVLTPDLDIKLEPMTENADLNAAKNILKAGASAVNGNVVH